MKKEKVSWVCVFTCLCWMWMNVTNCLKLLPCDDVPMVMDGISNSNPQTTLPWVSFAGCFVVIMQPDAWNFIQNLCFHRLPQYFCLLFLLSLIVFNLTSHVLVYICCSMCVKVREQLCRVSHLFTALWGFWGWTRLHGRHLYPVSQAPPFFSFSFMLEAFPRLPISTWDRLWKPLIRRFGWSGEGMITDRACGWFGGQCTKS